MTHSFKAYYQIDITDENGKVHKGRKRVSHSFTVGFVNALELVMAHAILVAPDNMVVVDTSGNNKTLPQSGAGLASFCACEAAATVTAYGIVAGIGTTAPTSTDRALGSLIANGSGAGQLNYGAGTVGASGSSGNDSTVAVSRALSNGSANTVTITEIGLIMAMRDTTPATIYLLVIRDLATKAVLSGQIATITYTIVATV